MKEHLIVGVKEDTPAYLNGIRKNDILVSINGREIEDIFDYHYIAEDCHVELGIIKEADVFSWKNAKKQKDLTTIIIDKDEDEDLGLLFEESLMDNYRSCYNKCVFCFIDQNPKGMRETIYFKDDDSRLSFLQGNYITMTNMKEKDIKRIIEYKLAPINISVHTTNPELRCQMLHNRFAGNVLEYIKMLYEAEIPMNGQIVLCKGLNDGDELRRTIGDLVQFAPIMESVSVVPVGLTKYRDGLCELRPFTAEDSKEVIEIVKHFQDIAYEKHGIHFIHASDEWYINAGVPVPDEDNYDGYIQLENGVGMTRLLQQDFSDAVLDVLEYKEKTRTFFSKLKHNSKEDRESKAILTKNKGRKVSTICGMLSYGNKEMICEELKKIRPDIDFQVFPIRNDFFGPKITVTGLLTGRDIVAQLKDKDLGEALLIPNSCLKADEDIFLDDMTLEELSKALQVETIIVKSYGADYLKCIVGVET